MNGLKQGSLLQGGKYRIESVLGQGGFGITYGAVQVALNRRVAIKEFFMKEYCERNADTSHVTLGTAGSAETVQRFKEKFMKEAALIAQFDNPHIVRIHDIFEENGTAYYVMEFLEDRWNQFGKNGIAQEQSLNIIRQVGEGLIYIHAQNVLHLDVKPSNIMFRKDCAVLIDFGISKRYDSEGGQTSTTPVGISKGYAPLEQYNQDMQKFQPATDVYSLAATLYKLLTGETPPEASEINEDGIPPCPSNVSHILWEAIEKAMQPRRKDRPQSIRDFLSLLDTKDMKSPFVDEETEILKDSSFMEIQTIEANGVSFKMIRVDGGTFTMGATSEQGSDALDDEKPTHQVTLSSYQIGETEVTQSLWEAVMGSNPSKFKGANRPVERVSWDDCQTFISKLNAMTGKTFRLPTEAEWEFAARGGNRSKGYKYSGGNTLGNVAWYGDNSGDETHDVKTKSPNELGIYDMSGNVWEWCQDWYGKYSSSSQTNPTGPSSGSSRVYRGGSWYFSARCCRVSFRNCSTPDNLSYFLGLRLAL